jgi:hypothetical protein
LFFPEALQARLIKRREKTKLGEADFAFSTWQARRSKFILISFACKSESDKQNLA